MSQMRAVMELSRQIFSRHKKVPQAVYALGVPEFVASKASGRAALGVGGWEPPDWPFSKTDMAAWLAGAMRVVQHC